MLCRVCNEVASKYKCSTCCCPYCSLQCWEKHKSSDECQAPPKVLEKNAKVNGSNIKYFTEDTVSPEKLSLLGESEPLKKILQNRFLRQTLIAVDNAINPEKAVYDAMQDPDFVNFVDKCLEIVEDLND